MAKKRSAQLDQEIREALAQIPRKPGLKSRAELDAEIDAILAGGLPAERYEIARALGFQYPKRPPPKKMTVTDTNISALADQVVQGGGHRTFSNRVHQVDYPHIRRTITGGLVTVSSPTTLTLTPEGYEAVLRKVRKDYEGWSARDRSRFSHYDQERLDKLRVALTNLEAAA